MCQTDPAQHHLNQSSRCYSNLWFSRAYGFEPDPSTDPKITVSESNSSPPDEDELKNRTGCIPQSIHRLMRRQALQSPQIRRLQRKVRRLQRGVTSLKEVTSQLKVTSQMRLLHRQDIRNLQHRSLVLTMDHHLTINYLSLERD